MKGALLFALLSSTVGCVLDIPEVGNPFEREPDLIVSPSRVPLGVSQIEVEDADRRVDFRDVWDVDDAGDFIVLDWFSNEDRLVVEIDVSDQALGAQDLEIELEEDADLLFATFDVE